MLCSTPKRPRLGLLTRAQDSWRCGASAPSGLTVSTYHPNRCARPWVTGLWSAERCAARLVLLAQVHNTQERCAGALYTRSAVQRCTPGALYTRSAVHQERGAARLVLLAQVHDALVVLRVLRVPVLHAGVRVARRRRATPCPSKWLFVSHPEGAYACACHMSSTGRALSHGTQTVFLFESLSNPAERPESR